MTLALDEVANVAPIASFPALVSEAGGQGLHVLAAVQDLSQVRGRWGGEVAEGFLSLFQHVLVLGGVRDTRTLEALSVICGVYDRPLTSTTKTRTRSREPFHVFASTHAVARSANTSTMRQRLLPPGGGVWAASRAGATPARLGLALHPPAPPLRASALASRAR